MGQFLKIYTNWVKIQTGLRNWLSRILLWFFYDVYDFSLIFQDFFIIFLWSLFDSIEIIENFWNIIDWKNHIKITKNYKGKSYDFHVIFVWFSRIFNHFSMISIWFYRNHRKCWNIIDWKNHTKITKKIIRDWLMIAFITCKSSLVPLLEGLCTSNPCRFEFSVFLSFCRNRTDDLRINSPALWPTELVLHRFGCKKSYDFSDLYNFLWFLGGL